MHVTVSIVIFVNSYQTLTSLSCVFPSVVMVSYFSTIVGTNPEAWFLSEIFSSSPPSCSGLSVSELVTGFWCLFGCIFRVYTKYIEIVTTTIVAISAMMRITEMIMAVLLLPLTSTFLTANNNNYYYYDNSIVNTVTIHFSHIGKSTDYSCYCMYSQSVISTLAVA